MKRFRDNAEEPCVQQLAALRVWRHCRTNTALRLVQRPFSTHFLFEIRSRLDRSKDRTGPSRLRRANDRYWFRPGS